MLHGKVTYKGTVDRLKECDLLPVEPLDNRVLKLITEAKGNFTAGYAHGEFELKFREHQEYLNYKGRLFEGMFAGVGNAEVKKGLWISVKWDEAAGKLVTA